MNNFQRLQEEQEEEFYNEARHDQLRSGLHQTLGTFRFIGQVIDIYLPRVVDMLIVATGGNSGRDDDAVTPRLRSQDPSSGPIMDRKNLGPKGPDGEIAPPR
ncbi:MAG: hypothetical protein DHS20C18_22450 [Saprospiraceae bacterium]|nr:MAG: hypothetical protein DHS20C18_22450 [Saprospiraceae bacterium]